MSYRSIRFGRVIVALFIFAFAATAYGGKPKATTVQFQNACAAGVQTDFARAITLLHSFEYPASTAAFNEIIRRDPSCVMARWGAAMSLWHPLWAPPDKAALQQGAEILAAASKLPATPRESAYVQALGAFFSSDVTGTHGERAKAYELAMSRVYASNLGDPEAAVFYALALLGSADPHDKSYANQFKSAGLLNWVRSSQPTHPGVLHYLIHSYDFPGLAHLALDAAQLYADVAPDSTHAQHMPSHIFTRLGLWQKAIASNQHSADSALHYTEEAGLPGHYDEGLHSIDYLMYALLQTARDDEARQLLDRLAGIKRTDTENFKVAYAYAASPARYALERRMWREAADLELIREDFRWQEFPWAESIHHFARGIGAARSGQTDKAQNQLETIRTLQRGMPAATQPYWREQVQVHLDALSAWTMLAEGNQDEAEKLALAAADREDSVDRHPVTPGEVLPARELYADLLYETNQPEKALAQYRMVMQNSPNRINSLLGAAHSAEKSGDTDVARSYFAVVVEQTRSGNRQRMGLADARKKAQ